MTDIAFIRAARLAVKAKLAAILDHHGMKPRDAANPEDDFILRMQDGATGLFWAAAFRSGVNTYRDVCLADYKFGGMIAKALA